MAKGYFIFFCPTIFLSDVTEQRAYIGFTPFNNTLERTENNLLDSALNLKTVA